MVSVVLAERLVVAAAVLLFLAGAADVWAAPAPSPTPVAQRWEGVEKRTPGFVLFGKRWVPGTLVVKDGTVYWSDGGNGRRNVLLPTGAVASQSLSCPAPAGPCTWTVRTRRTDFVFRDGAKLPAAGGGTRAAFAALLEFHPGLPSGKKPGEE